MWGVDRRLGTRGQVDLKGGVSASRLDGHLPGALGAASFCVALV